MKKTETLYPQLVNWMSLSWYDIKSRYRRTVIGPFWIVLNTLISIVFLGLVYKTIFKLPIKDFLPYVAAGIIIWNLLFSNTAESCTAFITQKYLLQGIPVSQEFIVLRLVCRNAIIFFHNLLVLIIILLVFQTGISWHVFFMLPGMIMVFLTSVALGILLAYMSARFRDLPQLVTSLLGILFLVTPVIWPQRLLGDNQLLAVLNPFTHLISVIREPILGRAPSLFSWVAVMALFVVLGLGAFQVSRRFRFRLIYWL